MAQLEQQARSGQPISLMDLAVATHREEREKKKSIEDQPKNQPKPEHKKHRKKARKGRIDTGNFPFEEMNLMCIYNTRSRTGPIESLNEMRGELSAEETELMKLTDSTLRKLQTMTDDEFAELELYPDFDE